MHIQIINVSEFSFVWGPVLAGIDGSQTENVLEENYGKVFG